MEDLYYSTTVTLTPNPQSAHLQPLTQLGPVNHSPQAPDRRFWGFFFCFLYHQGACLQPVSIQVMLDDTEHCLETPSRCCCCWPTFSQLTFPPDQASSACLETGFPGGNSSRELLTPPAQSCTASRHKPLVKDLLTFTDAGVTAYCPAGKLSTLQY